VAERPISRRSILPDDHEHGSNQGRPEYHRWLGASCRHHDLNLANKSNGQIDVYADEKYLLKRFF
jgi:hypothetical protein